MKDSVFFRKMVEVCGGRGQKLTEQEYYIQGGQIFLKCPPTIRDGAKIERGEEGRRGMSQMVRVRLTCLAPSLS